MINTGGPVKLTSISRDLGRVGLLVLATAAFGAVSFLGVTAANASDPVSPHQNLTTDADGCAACHRVHSDQADTFNANNQTPRSIACFTCHDGTGATSDVSSQYSGASLNDPATRTYYSHPSNATGTGHQTAEVTEDGGIVPVNEFAGVHNRHSDCVDCHNPHNASVLPASIESATGWTASGSLAGSSVVEATFPENPNTTPTYNFVGFASSSNKEYQLCLKCHSSFTELSSNTGWDRSKWYRDFGKLINPNNVSFHPIAGPGHNTSTALANSLAGDPTDTFLSDFRTHTVTSVIACGDCHGAANGGVHATGNPNILRFRYRSELLKPSSESFDAAEFKLCFTCHSDLPFKMNSTTFTNFPEHYAHMTSFKGSGTTGGTVNDAGAGNGLALCAECHFDSHSSALPDANQDLPGTRLVQFAPNVEPNGGVIKFVARDGATQGGCTLTCHGVAHTVGGKPYPAN